jgi:hypothetical protein
VSATIPSIEPEQFAAGDTVQWYRSVSDYPPDDGWALTYAFVGAQGLFTATGVDNGDGRYLVTLDAATTATILAASYGWSGAVTQGLERHTIGAGTTVVLPDLLATGAPFDTRTRARKILDAITATIEGTATTDQASYSVGDVSISRMPIPDLLVMRDRFTAEVAREEHAERLRKGLGSAQNIMVRL